MESRLPSYDTMRVARLKNIPTEHEWNTLVRAVYPRAQTECQNQRAAIGTELLGYDAVKRKGGIVLERPVTPGCPNRLPFASPENPAFSFSRPSTIFSTVDRIIQNELVYASVLHPGKETRNDGRDSMYDFR